MGTLKAILLAAAASLLLAAAAAAQRLDPPVREWLDQHRLLLVPEEVVVLRRLKPDDLEAFIRIFWARRDPAPGSPENRFRAAADRARADADARFGEAGRKGSETACGQAVMLLGNPDEVTGRELRNTFDTRPSAPSRYRVGEPASRNATRDGARRPELWVYKSSPTRAFRMPGGDLKLQFDDGCEFDEGTRTLDELARAAAALIRHPGIGYEFAADGRLRPLAAVARPSSPAAALLERPSADFTLSFEPKIQVPAQSGSYVAGVLRGLPGSLTLPPGEPFARLQAVARAVRPTGAAVPGDERDVVAEVAPDGSFISSYGLTLPAGRFAVKVALFDPMTGRGAVTALDIESPDYAGGTLVVSPLVVLAGLEEAASAPGGPDPYAAFAIGSQRLRPRAGNVLEQGGSLRLLVLLHNAPLDPASGRASIKASFSVLREGAVVAKSSEQAYDTAGAAPSVGPIPLTPFSPGRYVARVEIADGVGKTVVVRETPFEVRLP
jgi:GWxTD domain-containing protein